MRFLIAIWICIEEWQLLSLSCARASWKLIPPVFELYNYLALIMKKRFQIVCQPSWSNDWVWLYVRNEEMFSTDWQVSYRDEIFLFDLMIEQMVASNLFLLVRIVFILPIGWMWEAKKKVGCDSNEKIHSHFSYLIIRHIEIEKYVENF